MVTTIYKAAKLIENLQRRAIKLTPNIKDLLYSQRLKILKLPTLKYSRLKDDLINVYKFWQMTNHVAEIYLLPLNKSKYKTRGHDR